jgi:transcriptional regulator of arginine metabolism
MTKQARQFAIKEILAAAPIASQNELRLELRRRGVKVTQATLSRDLKNIGVSRVVAGERAQYTLETVGEMRNLRPLVGAEVLSIVSNESLIVIRTLPGCANTVGEFIDVEKHPHIIGTVAGDNTLLVIPRSHKNTKHVVDFLKQKLIEGA